MTATITNLKERVFGNKRVCTFDVAVGLYAAGGISLVASDIGLTQLELVLVSPNSGISYTYNTSTSKIMAFRQPSSTSTGVITAPITVTQGDVTITGPAAATTVLLEISTDSVTGTFMKEAATARRILAGTFGIPVPTASIAPVFTGGTSTTAVLVEATGTLATATRCLAIGY
jgi:hypothetical protein